MAIVKMKRFRLIALEQDRAALLSELQRLGSTEVTEAEANLSEAEWAELLTRGRSSANDVKAQISLVNRALDALRKYAPTKDGLLPKRPFMTEEEFFDAEKLTSSLHTAQTIDECLDEISKLQALENRLTAVQMSLVPWKELGIAMNNLSTKNVYITTGVCPAAADIAQVTAALAEAAPLAALIPVSSDREQHYLIFLCHKSEQEAAETALKLYAFSVTRFTGMTGTAAQEIDSLQAQIEETVKLRADEEAKIAALAEERFALRHGLDVITQNYERELAQEHMLVDGTIAFMEAWTTEPKVPQLEEILSKYDCAYSLETPTLEETPPTLLKNNKLFTPLNMVTEMYSLPAYHGGIDPNILIFPFFIPYYGIMFGDVGYGIVMFLAGFFLTKKYRPKGTIGYMAGLAQICGISAIIFGCLTGSFFGDLIPVCADVFFGKTVVIPAVISPLEDPMLVLGGALLVGCFQLFVGQCIHIYMGFRDKEGIEALLDVVPWWIFLGGCAVLALGHGSTVILIGVAALVLTQGRAKKTIIGKFLGGLLSLYDVTAWLGDILSYARVMALMLAGGVVASVVNMLGTLPANIFIFIPIFLFGHTFNLGINTIGNYVHSARLQYLEYFSKFYKDGGIPFHPLSYKTKYVDVIEASEKKL